MAKYIGRLVNFGAGKEATRGTAVSASFWIPKQEFSFDDKVNKFRIQSDVGTIEDSEQAHVLTKWGEGDVSGEVRDRSIGLFLSAAMGSVSTAGPASGAYTHTFTLSNTASHPSMTFVVKDPNTTERYANVVLSALEFSQELDGVLNYTATFMGRASKGASATTDYTVENKFTKRHTSFKVAASTGGLAAASNLSIKSVTLTIVHPAEPDDALGTAVPEDFNNLQFGVEGGITLNYTDETWKNYELDNDYKSLELKWTNTEEEIPGGTTNPSIEFEMPKVDFYDWEPNYALDEIVSQEISFKANRSLGTSEDMMTATLVNAHDGTSY